MKVSVILTSYNHEKFIKKSIESVLAQTYKDFKLIIVDDCSTDSSWNIIQQFNDERIIAIRNSQNLRTEGFYNALHKYVDGTYIAVHHSDDEWNPDKLEKQVEFMDANPKIAACFTRVQVIDEDENEYCDEEGFYYNLFNQNNRSRYEWLRYFFYHGNCLCHPSVLLRSKLFFEEEMFDFGYAQIPDFSRWVRICLKHDIYIMPEKLIKFRIQNDGKNTSGSRADTIIRSSIEWYHLLHLYANFETRDEFIKVFPEGEIFAKEEAYIPEFAFARICTRPEMEAYTRLYGYELLYKLMNNRVLAKKIEKVYGFSFRNLIEMTGNKDIFHVLPEASNQCMTLYLTFEDERILKVEKKFYLNEYYRFEWKVEIPKEYVNKSLLKIRFDPAEGLYVMCNIEISQIDGHTFKMNAINAVDFMDGYEVFENLDPVYALEVKIMEGREVYIQGEVKRLTYSLMDKYNLLREEKKDALYQEINKRDGWIEQLKREKNEVMQVNEKQIKNYDLIVQQQKMELLDRERESIHQNETITQYKVKSDLLKKEIVDLREMCKDLSGNAKILEKQLDETKDELNQIKSHKVYRMWKKIQNIGGKK